MDGVEMASQLGEATFLGSMTRLESYNFMGKGCTCSLTGRELMQRPAGEDI